MLERLAGKIGPVAGQWSYTDLAGAEVFRIVRLQTGKTKTFRPLHRTADGWVVGDPPGLRPLYGLPELAGASRVFVAEGEKTAEAVRQLPGLIATTSAHGAKSPAWTDWGPLAGKEVVILPDHDAPGAGYVRLVLEQLARLTPRPTVRIVPLEMVWKTDAVIEEGNDVVDWLLAGVPREWTAAQCSQELVRAGQAATVIDLDAKAPGGPGIPPVGNQGLESRARATDATDSKSSGILPVNIGGREDRSCVEGRKPRKNPDTREPKDGERDQPKESTFDVLLRLASSARLTRTSDGRYYSRNGVNDHRESHNLHSRDFRNWLTLAFYNEQGHAPGPETVKTLTNLLEAMAASNGSIEETHVRVARSKDGRASYLDLGDPTWRAVEVRAGG